MERDEYLIESCTNIYNINIVKELILEGANVNYY